MTQHYFTITKLSPRVSIHSFIFLNLFYFILSTASLSQAQAPTVSISVSNPLSCTQLTSSISATASCADKVTYTFIGPNSFSLVNTTGVASVTINGVFSVMATDAAGTCVASNTALVSSNLHPDYLPLVDFYNSTGGPNWTNKTGWLTNCDPCSGWFGITCTEGRVTGLQLTNDSGLSGNNLSGTLPTSIGNLTELRKLNLAYSFTLGGTVPNSFTALTNLQELNLLYNNFRGTILDKLTGLTQLESIILGYNSFSGVIPENISALTKLRVFAILTNHLFDPSTGFTGTIPASLSTLKNLEDLIISDNQLTGTIPPSLGQLTNLKQLYLNNNKLTGQIPSELGDLINLNTFYLQRNQLIGSIPASLGNLKNVKLLGLSNNQLTGGIPLTLAGLNKMTSLYLSDNQFSGQIPNFFETLPSLQTIQLQNNLFTGSIPTSLSAVTGIQYIQLNNNQLTGTIPAGLANLTSLNFLWLQNNQLSGCIPQSLTTLCGRNVNIDNNDNLPSWNDFCANGTNSLVSVKDGSWFDSTVWSCGQIPTLKDYVTLQHSVLLPASSSGQSRKTIYKNGGKLNFDPGTNLKIGQ